MAQINVASKEISVLRQWKTQHEREERENQKQMKAIRRKNVDEVKRLQQGNNQVLQQLVDRIARLERVAGYGGIEGTFNDNSRRGDDIAMASPIESATSSGRTVKPPQRMSGILDGEHAISAMKRF